MNSNDVKREILLHAELLDFGEAMTKEQEAASIHQTIGTVFSAITAHEPNQRAWLVCQIAYAMARALDHEMNHRGDSI